YPAGYQTYITVEEVTRPLEGASRPGHFRGVATVVSKLFHLAQPHQAFFGQKDAQQVVVIQQMVRDLHFPLQVVVVPTLREPDGLAMSSRNVYLTTEERAAAPVIYRALQLASQRYDAGERDPDALREIVRNTVQANPLAQIDYISAADPHTLKELDSPTEQPILLSLAVQIGKPRLLDNMLLPASLNTVDSLSQTLNGSNSPNF
ncbi:MAG: 4-phosphopantoate--beta-alanine ligase, partial [Phototrophicaceae bacterium]